MNFFPNDYLLNRDLCSEEYSAGEFSKHEIERKSSFISNYLKLAFYPNLKKAIEDNSIDQIKLINNEMLQMGFHLKDFNPNSYLNDYIQGERYIPLLFLAFEHRSVASIQCLIELGIPLLGQMYISKSKINENSRWMLFLSRNEELQCFDIIDIINNLEDDVELKNAFQQHLSINDNSNNIEIQKDLNGEKLSTKQKMMKNFFRNEDNKSQTCVLL
jgi:hypothetical protein